MYNHQVDGDEVQMDPRCFLPSNQDIVDIGGSTEIVVLDSDEEPEGKYVSRRKHGGGAALIHDSDEEIESIFYENSWVIEQLDQIPSSPIQQTIDVQEPSLSIGTDSSGVLEHGGNADCDSDFSVGFDGDGQTGDWGHLHLQSEDSQESVPSTQNIVSGSSILDRYWYSDEELPPLENVYTLERLKSDPALRHMYEFFHCKIVG